MQFVCRCPMGHDGYPDFAMGDSAMMKPKMRIKLSAAVVAPRMWAAIVTFGLAMFLSVGQADAGGLVSYWAGDGNANPLSAHLHNLL